MERAIKIIKVIVSLVVVFATIMIITALILSEKIGGILLDTVNSKIPTKIEAESFRLSFIRKFPKASLEFKDITVLSAPSFNKAEFEDINVDTLLSASSLTMELDIYDIINKKYDISSIGIKKGKLHLFIDSSGANNYGINKTGEARNPEDNLILNLDKITLNDVEVAYNSLPISIKLNSFVEKGRLATRISGSDISFSAETDLLLNNYSHKSFTLNSPLALGIDVDLFNSDNGFNIKKGKLFVEGIQLGLTGSVSSDNRMDFKISGEKINLTTVRKYLPARYAQKLKRYDLRGVLFLESVITGKITEKENPHIDLTYRLENGIIRHQPAGLNVEKIHLKGSFTNGKGNNMPSSVILVTDFKANVGSGNVTAKMNVNNLKKPFADVELNGSLHPGEIKRLFNISKMPSMSGLCDFNLSLKSLLPPRDSMLAANLLRLKPVGSIVFHDMAVENKDNVRILSDVNGELLLTEILTAKNLQFEYKNQKVTVDGEFKNLRKWLAGDNAMVNANASVYFEKIIPDFLALFSSNGRSNKSSFKMPYNVSFDVRLKADSLINDRFPASDIEAYVVYKPGLLTFNSLQIRALEGTISGNGFILQSSDKQFISKCIFDVANVGIKKTFTTFRDFGQTFIKAENLDGSITGMVNLYLPSDSTLKIDVKSVVAEGNFVINKGSLVNFEPVKKLSSFIELSELENIRFDKLENDFFIRNNQLLIPQMEVISSAADFFINGRHGFDRNFEYHIKIRLSEILSAKRKRGRRDVTEFGAVEDDGLGRTSIFLVAQNKDAETKVSYDVKAMGNKVKEDIQTEKQNLKSLLKEEFGLFKNDTTITQQPKEESVEEKKPRFRIEWDEANVGEEPQNAPEKESPVRNLFRKK